MVTRSSFGQRWLAVPLVLLMGSPSWAGFTIQDLGSPMPTGTSGAAAINAAGQSTGTATGPGVAAVAVIGSGPGSFQAVGAPGAVTSFGRAINLQGTIAGYEIDSSGIRHGFYAGAGQMTVLKPLEVGTLSGTYTVLGGINDSGTAVGTGDIPGGANRAFTIGPGGSPTIIAPLGTGTFDSASGINNKGMVVGTSETSPGGLQEAFITDPTGVATGLLDRNSAGNFRYNTYGTAIDDNSDVVGYGDVGSSEHAFFAPAQGGKLIDLGLPYYATSSMANAVNDDGDVVGEVLYGPNPPGQPSSRAFLWSASTGMVDLNSLLLPSDQASWTLVSATGINDLGQISGQGYFDGALQGFALTPIPGGSLFEPAVQGVPGPPTLILSALGLAIAAAGAGLRRGRTGGRAAA